MELEFPAGLVFKMRQFFFFFSVSGGSGSSAAKEGEEGAQRG